MSQLFFGKTVPKPNDGFHQISTGESGRSTNLQKRVRDVEGIQVKSVFFSVLSGCKGDMIIQIMIGFCIDLLPQGAVLYTRCSSHNVKGKKIDNQTNDCHS